MEEVIGIDEADDAMTAMIPRECLPTSSHSRRQWRPNTSPTSSPTPTSEVALVSSRRASYLRWFDLLISIGSGGSIWFSGFRSTVIEVKLEVGDEGKVDGQRFPILVVWSAKFTCGDRRWHVEEACGRVVVEDE
ncbi:hypothetical protein Q3G72_004732 [Acer saccharum]|nr:hypothetical protein Q3G72_004732 [Acer saccharum]